VISAQAQSPTPTPNPAPIGGLSWSDPFVQGLLVVVKALVVVVIALVIANFAKRWTVRILSRSRVNLTVATLLGNLAQVVVLIMGGLYVFYALGFDWTGLLTLVGAAGLALSLSMQDLLKNVIAGVYLLMEQPFRIGDRITVKDVTGAVQGIELRTTILCTDDNLQVVVPNSTVLNEIVTNRSASNLQKQILLLYTSNAELSMVSGRVTDALRPFDDIAPAPAPLVAVEEIKDGTARLRIEFWVTAGKRVEVASNAAEALREAFPNASLTVV